MIKGLIAPILTPFDNDLKVDQKMYDDLAHELMNNGCSGLAPFGTTGEALSVGNKERMLAIEDLSNPALIPKSLFLELVYATCLILLKLLNTPSNLDV